MTDMIITVSGDHGDDVPTRLLALGDHVTFDVSTDSWIYNALNLGRFSEDATTEGFVPVPAEILWVALGRGCVIVGDDPKEWFATDSAPSDTLLNRIAINANAKGFASGDGGAGDAFETAWHMRAALAKFVQNNADYSGDDNAFIVEGEEDRFNASCASFTEACLMTYEDLRLQSLVQKKHADSWSMLLWLLGWSMQEPDEDKASPFCIVARALVKAAEVFAPHVAEASPADAVAAFLRSGEQLPPDMLTDDFDLGTKLAWIGAVRDYAKPSMRPALFESSFDTVLERHPLVAKWTGSGADAFSNFSSLVDMIFPGSMPGFVMVQRLGGELSRSYDDYWQEGSRSANINFLREAVGTGGRSTTGGGHAVASSSETDVRTGRGAHANAALLTSLVSAIDGWRAGDADESEDAPDRFKVTDIILQSGYTQAIKWVLGLGQAGLPSVFSDEDIVPVPLEWPEFFLDTLVTGSDGERDDMLVGLKVTDFPVSFLTNLKAGKIAPGHIDWDKDFVCVLLRRLNADGHSAPMDTARVLCDADRLAHHLGLFAS